MKGEASWPSRAAFPGLKRKKKNKRSEVAGAASQAGSEKGTIGQLSQGEKRPKIPGSKNKAVTGASLHSR